ncbi:alpha/beta hydrolase [Acaricomes phytoseiuli]|uniref:alpha/beta fold hydrolase n=1 Tax=Acaricomes phytoseiuli TaxID=291968 RepID=UPI0006850E5E|nr:alpha/beta fold hydrolase [Acaricomes phytoseiuli]MCW1249097.1 alpha/beta hydrolase [Acaricomes phytoseiuli]
MTSSASDATPLLPSASSALPQKPVAAQHRIGERVERDGIVYQEHFALVPLDHLNPEGEQIELFAREVARAEAPDAPWLVYFQGGPGGRADRPNSPSGWVAEALKDFRVLLLDQRGTGRSTPATRQTLPARGDAAKQAEYLKYFRADAIVADAESLRQALQSEPWSILGQSFGGFCALSYLSWYPEGLREVLITAGLAPLAGHPDRVYRATFERTAARNREFFARYPQAQQQAARIARHLAEHEEFLPTGERLTPQRFQMLGSYLGGNSRIDGLAYLLEDAFPLVEGQLPDAFLEQVGHTVSYAQNPLYAVLHESIYCQGQASGWSAARVAAERGDMDPLGEEFHFTGEAVMPWYFTEDPALAPLAEVAEILASKSDWPALYDPARLAATQVPVAATAYFDDIYVDHGLAAETAAAVRGLQLWQTGEYHHDGLRADGERIFAKLLAMTRAESSVS